MNTKWVRRILAEKVQKARVEANLRAISAKEPSERLAYVAAGLAMEILHAELTKED